MNDLPRLAQQVDVVARELAALNELLGRAPVGVPVDEAISLVESAGRLMDCARVRVLAPLVGDVAEAQRLGYASPIAAVASLARISERSARARLTVAGAICDDRSITGAPLPAPHPVVGSALAAGEVGLDAAALITSELASIAGRALTEVLEFAESVMVGLATGVSPTGECLVSTVSVGYLAGEIRQIAAAADPDGARPREERARRRRDFRLGTPDDDGLIPASGKLLPEIGLLLAGMLEAHRRSPRFADATLSVADDLTLDSPAADSRTPGQRRHDALGEILLAAAASESSPRLDGQAVTVLVTVSAADLVDENGRDTDAIGTMAGSRFPVSRRTIERFIDAGGYRVATIENGTVQAISSPQRCFTGMIRLGIAVRDGYRCLVPGCTSPQYTLQAHHVVPDRDDGPTALDNGVLLCYWHHLIVDTGPWHFRMVDGRPQVRGPGVPEWTWASRELERAA